MSVLINMEMPDGCLLCPLMNDQWQTCKLLGDDMDVPLATRRSDCPLVLVPPHGRLIDADALRAAMYHEAFETGTPMQKWDSGCWIRYKMFERAEESAPTIIPASEEGE